MPDPVVTPGEPVVVAPETPALPSDGGPAGGLLAGKFANAEELAKGYSNLATLLGKQGKLDDAQLAALVAKLPAPAPAPAAAPVTPVPAAAAPAPNPLQIDPAAVTAIESAGLKIEDMNAEYAKDGKLSDASMAKLEKVGITKEIVSAFIDGQESIRKSVETRAYSQVGGEEKYTQMVGWAKTGFTPEETAAFNAAVIGTPAAQALAIAGLKSKYEAAAGSGPALVRGNAAGGSGGGYESDAQIRADMKDPRYQKDQAFRDAVRAKVSRSGLFS